MNRQTFLARLEEIKVDNTEKEAEDFRASVITFFRELANDATCLWEYAELLRDQIVADAEECKNYVINLIQKLHKLWHIKNF